MPIIVVTGKEIEKIKGDYESYLSGLNMVGEIDYSQYSQLYDEGTKHIQRAYELGKSELEKENAELKADNAEWEKVSDKWKSVYELTNNQLTNAKELLKTFMKISEENGRQFDEEVYFEAREFFNQSRE